MKDSVVSAELQTELRARDQHPTLLLRPAGRPSRRNAPVPPPPLSVVDKLHRRLHEQEKRNMKMKDNTEQHR